VDRISRVLLVFRREAIPGLAAVLDGVRGISGLLPAAPESSVRLWDLPCQNPRVNRWSTGATDRTSASSARLQGQEGHGPHVPAAAASTSSTRDRADR
jgi:hypothetical protein